MPPPLKQADWRVANDQDCLIHPSVVTDSRPAERIKNIAPGRRRRNPVKHAH